MDYLTINGFASAEFIEKKSRFIGYVKPVTTKEQAEEFIAEIKAKHYNATHNVPAYILLDGNIERYSDDGEPQGTAGIPILEVLKKEGLTNVCVVITRYFGGIMLGAGGLVRAYSKGCKIALGASKYILMCECRRMRIKFDYSLYGKISYLLPGFEVKIEESDFSDKIMLQLLVRLQLVQKLIEKLAETTNARVSIELGEKDFSSYPYNDI